MDNISKIIKRENTILFTKAKDVSITMTNALLSNINLPTIPNDYADFLKITNGIITNTYNLYGTENIKETNFHYINIYEKNQNHKNLFKNFKDLIIGETLLNIIIYDNKKYKIVDNFTLQPLQEFNNFETILTYLEND